MFIDGVLWLQQLENALATAVDVASDANSIEAQLLQLERLRPSTSTASAKDYIIGLTEHVHIQLLAALAPGQQITYASISVATAVTNHR
jgi:hypothetical protein